MFNFGRYGKWIFLLVSALVVAAFLYFSNILVNDLSERERERMEIWADATKEILRQFGDGTTDDFISDSNSEEVNYTIDGATDFNFSEDTETPADVSQADESEFIPVTNSMPVADISFLLRILEGNTTIPVLLLDEDNNISLHRNFNLPEPYESTDQYNELSEKNRKYLDDKLKKLSRTSNVIDIEIEEGVVQHLYYEDSLLLQRLNYYPYVQLAVMIVFLLVVYFAVTSSKEAEQNKVWVGLSKETAHQLGTPISSLMAWMELLPEMGTDVDTCSEMNKDVKRLSTIASRFSKIGSRPAMEKSLLSELSRNATEYMSSRISSKIILESHIKNSEIEVLASAPLFEWVMENLIKNAVDAMEGTGNIDITVLREKKKAVIEVKDTGKGIPSKNRKRVFKPGFTTKKRGWGLGLTLAKRIIEQYHKGKIFVKETAPGKGTTFRIELPVSEVNLD